MELEENDELQYLDLLLNQQLNGNPSCIVYRKRTHVNRYLFQIKAIAKTLIHRSKSDNFHKSEEIDKITKALYAND